MAALLAVGMLLGVAGEADAIDFKAKGEWLVGFGLADVRFVNKVGGRQTDSEDVFGASQRIRLQLDAVASEALSGTVFFEIGDHFWGWDGGGAGRGAGGALGADGVSVEVKNAYLDWVVPQTDLRFRMGLQAIALPNFAGGSAILDADVAAVVANYHFNENVGLTAMWMRPVNDNFSGYDDLATGNGARKGHYLDNIDLFALTLPLTFDGFEATPWAMYGMMGKNALDGYGFENTARGWEVPLPRYGGPRKMSTRTFSGADPWETADGNLLTLVNYHPGFNLSGRGLGTSAAWSPLFFVGLPVNLTLWDPLNIEFEFNYGYSGGAGSYGLLKRGWQEIRADSRREGWLAKALIEYKLEWGVPGIFGWYASGDRGNMKNGSRRMPTVAGAGSFTSFMGAGGIDWASTAKGGDAIERNMTYAGTWGIGLHLRDMSFLEDLSHTFRVALWGGTNSPSMTKYFANKDGWDAGYGDDGPYMTTHDNLLEFNLDTTWQVYENLAVQLDLGYIVNMYDSGTWNRRWMGNDDVKKKDAWKAQLTFAYTF